jgi:putative oxidoreductase
MAKLLGLPSSLRHQVRMRVPRWLWRATGLAQLIGVMGLLLGLWRPAVVPWAASLLIVIMLGALLAHLRARDGWQHYLTVVVLLALSLLVMQASLLP